MLQTEESNGKSEKKKHKKSHNSEGTPALAAEPVSGATSEGETLKKKKKRKADTTDSE